MASRKNYTEETERLVKAIDLAIEALQMYPPVDLTKEQFASFVEGYIFFRQLTKVTEPQYQKLTSLKYLENDVFTYFQEGSGSAVEYFWQKIHERKLGYLRKDKLSKIIKRNSIKGRIEYEYLIDVIVVAQQENRITPDEALKLSKLIDRYENKKTLTITQQTAFVNYEQLGSIFQLAHPTNEHYLPMLYTLCLADKTEELKYLFVGFQFGRASMRCFQIS